LNDLEDITWLKLSVSNTNKVAGFNGVCFSCCGHSSHGFTDKTIPIPLQPQPLAHHNSIGLSPIAGITTMVSQKFLNEQGEKDHSNERVMLHGKQIKE
jgi:hypothetical protein